MKLIDDTSLTRGETLVHFALSGEHRTLHLDVPDLIGVVAAYIADRGTTNGMEEHLSEHLSPSIADRAARTLALFDDPDGRGLWTQGPATDDIRFTDPELNRRYPHVQQRFDALFAPCYTDRTPSQLF